MDNKARESRLADGAFVAIAAAVITVLVAACASSRLSDDGGAAATAGSTAASAGAAGSTSLGAPEGEGPQEVVVTGSRVGGQQAQHEQRAEHAQRAEPAPHSATAGGLVTIPPSLSERSAAIAGSAPIAAAGADVGREAQPHGVAGSLFSRVRPGEEIWVIETLAVREQPAEVEDDQPGSGALLALVTRADDPQRSQVEVPLPLQHTDVHAVITGYVGSVDVTQQFANPYDEKIEAVYMFPLPEKAAVSEFVMTIGERKIRGILREKEEAQRIYQDARAQGYRASLLVQYRPNVFEQKVANIEPGKRIDVNIRYFHTLAYEDGWYSFVFPTVVGPRYNPAGLKDPVTAVPRGDNRDPVSGTAVRYLRPNERSAHDIGIAVDLDAGVAIEELAASHAIKTTMDGRNRAHVELASASTIPNRDFVLRFRVAGDEIKSSFLTYTDPKSKQGYFTLMIYPPSGLAALARRPLEMVFVIDTSGSMSGRPLEQATAAVSAALDRLGSSDTFQIMNFSTYVSSLAAAPLPATRENRDRGRRYLRSLGADGGTEMLGGIRAALNYAPDPQRDRFVAFLTDGYIGNEAEIFSEVHRLIGGARIFSFGVGNSVNRYLLDGLAMEGRGAAAYLALEDSADEVMSYFFERISHPALTDVSIDWRGLAVSDVYPRRIPDLFVGRPVVITGQFKGGADTIAVHGRAGKDSLTFGLVPAVAQPAIRTLWARLRIEDLARRYTWSGSRDLAADIRSTALEYGLMSAYTSFVAVDASERTPGEHGTTVNQAVPVPDGVHYKTTVAERGASGF
jgi:Ca-activated chloride channel family protein